jgi:hypothetical protein
MLYIDIKARIAPACFGEIAGTDGTVFIEAMPIGPRFGGR